MIITKVTKMDINKECLEGNGRIGDINYRIEEYGEYEGRITFNFVHLANPDPASLTSVPNHLAQCAIDQHGTLLAKVEEQTHARVIQVVGYLQSYATKLHLNF